MPQNPTNDNDPYNYESYCRTVAELFPGTTPATKEQWEAFNRDLDLGAGLPVTETSTDDLKSPLEPQG
jgi:hypothetical protein